jgi:hypothetical protein
LNVFGKLKLKAQLKNCDYILAGTVLKQQFYQENGQGKLSRLIDQLLETPCFDNALKLIEHDPMFTFYFTESCNGGLYVKKKDHARETGSAPTEGQGESESGRQTAPRSEEKVLPSSTGAKHEKITETPIKAQSDKKKTRVEDQMDQLMKTIAEIQGMKPGKAPIQAQIEKQIEADSARNDNVTEIPADPNPLEPINTPDGEAKKEIAAAAEDTVEPQLEETNTRSRSKKSADSKSINSFFKKIGSLNIAKRTPSEEESYLTEEETSHDHMTDNGDAEIAPAGPRFPNVIATLEKDIITLHQQLEECKLSIKINPQDSEKYREWIPELEKALDEFTRAVEVLEGRKK